MQCLARRQQRLLAERYASQKVLESTRRLHNATLSKRLLSDNFQPRNSRHTRFHLHVRRYATPKNDSQTRNEHETETNEPARDPRENYSAFYRRLSALVPHIRRPTAEDFLKVADGFWERLRIRFKWFTIRSFRPFGVDDMSAFFTWFLMSQTVWILVGTTTFFSAIFATVNSLRLQEYVASALSDYLTSETGIKISFESAIVPKWKDSRISFKNVIISRNEPILQMRNTEAALSPANIEHMDESIISIHVDSIDVTLDLPRWLEGKGLIADAIVNGVRGLIDRRHLPPVTLDPAEFRHPAAPGSFHLKHLALSDVLLTVLEPSHRPYTISILSAHIGTLRKQWLVYDLLSECEGMTGMFDGCLFSLHRPQMVETPSTTSKANNSRAGRMSRLRIDGVNISHIQALSSAPHSASSSGPIQWIRSGKVDAVLDFKFPSGSVRSNGKNDMDLGSVLSEIGRTISNAAVEMGVVDNDGRSNSHVRGDTHGRVPGRKPLARPALTAPSLHLDDAESDDERLIVDIDVDIRFRDIKAAMPYFQRAVKLGYGESAMARAIVGFMNANRTLIPIHCRVAKSVEDFDGSWTLWETGLMDDVSDKIHTALAHHVTQSHMNQRRLKTVSLWSLQVTANSVMGFLRSLVDPVSEHIRDLYMEPAMM